MDTVTRVVTVEIQGLRYPIRSALAEQYVIELAGYIDAKMARAASEVPTGETLKIAVLAALNVADELFRCRTASAPDRTEVVRRTHELERIVDQAINRLHL